MSAERWRVTWLGVIRGRHPCLADTDGSLLIMNTFGSMNWSPGRETVHPSLVYSEMLSEVSERGREAAQAIHERYLAPLWQTGANGP
jgi:hypothetical protein